MAGSGNKVRRALGKYRRTITDGHKAMPLSGRALWHFVCQVSVVETGLVECAKGRGPAGARRRAGQDPDRFGVGQGARDRQGPHRQRRKAPPQAYAPLRP
ncbi:hypothetical protein GCM10007036_14040 [Alsobacter metallidurans]|uniref:Uncharacterized protein n=1 Tax=Alsobacter metallidurans TaxID=340221 RepID=A0A917I5J5_9HYPH|nr:hypothetical protein GCM10007036_14040 [Alsobacter metallidurans]